MAVTCVSLRDAQSAATATVAVGFGFNCFQFAVERAGKMVEILWATEDFATGQARPSGSGIPLLFPFPGRIASGVLRWDAREYHLPRGDGRGNAIHGFVLDRPWRLIEQTSDRVVGEFQASVDDPSLLELWPADFRLRASYELRGESLVCQLDADNPDERMLPCGMGTHPYFRLPLGGSVADICQVKLPISEEWELADMIPTGRRSPVDAASRMQQGMPYSELRLDNAFTGLTPPGGPHLAKLYDPETKLTVEQIWDGVFRECVVYTPGHREAICIEPLTCVPGAFDLAARGVDAGLRILPPGGRLTGTVTIAVR